MQFVRSVLSCLLAPVLLVVPPCSFAAHLSGDWVATNANHVVGLILVQAGDQLKGTLDLSSFRIPQSKVPGPIRRHRKFLVGTARGSSFQLHTQSSTDDSMAIHGSLHGDQLTAAVNDHPVVLRRASMTALHRLADDLRAVHRFYAVSNDARTTTLRMHQFVQWAEHQRKIAPRLRFYYDMQERVERNCLAMTRLDATLKIKHPNEGEPFCAEYGPHDFGISSKMTMVKKALSTCQSEIKAIDARLAPVKNAYLNSIDPTLRAIRALEPSPDASLRKSLRIYTDKVGKHPKMSIGKFYLRYQNYVHAKAVAQKAIYHQMVELQLYRSTLVWLRGQIQKALAPWQ